jgi:hypothetical protein
VRTRRQTPMLMERPEDTSLERCNGRMGTGLAASRDFCALRLTGAPKESATNLKSASSDRGPSSCDKEA